MLNLIEAEVDRIPPFQRFQFSNLFIHVPLNEGENISYRSGLKPAKIFFRKRDTHGVLHVGLPFVRIKYQLILTKLH